MIEFYKPKPTVKGSACRFYLNEVENSFFASIIRQKSWDAKARKASFHANDPENKVILKFSQKEICSFIDAIKRNTDFKGYHGSNQIVKFKFGPYVNKEGNQLGFSLGVTKEKPDDSTSGEFFAIGFDFPESVQLVLFFEYILLRSFEITRKKRIKDAKQRVKEAEEKAPEPEPKPDVKDDDSDIW